MSYTSLDAQLDAKLFGLTEEEQLQANNTRVTTGLEAFSKRAKAKAQRRAEALEIMKSGYGEILWMYHKEELNDFDSYMVALNRLYKMLNDGYYDFTNEDNKPIPKPKPAPVQYRIMLLLLRKIKKHFGNDLAFDLSLKGLSALKARRDERKAKKAISAGTQTERRQFEGEMPNKPYAKADNENAIAEYEAKITSPTIAKINARKRTGYDSSSLQRVGS